VSLLPTSALFACLLILEPALGAQIMDAPRRDIPDDNLAYPVLVTLDNRDTGSGFYLRTGDRFYLVTARHVLFKISADPSRGKHPFDLKTKTVELLSYPRDPKEAGRILLKLDLVKLESEGATKPHPTAEVAVVRIGTVETKGTSWALKPAEGVEVKELAPSGLVAVAMETADKLDQVMVANEVYIFGYPTSLGLKQIPQIDYERPLLRKGVVAGNNEKLGTIVLDCPAYQGNSGGAVLEVQRAGLVINFRVIGVITAFVPFAETWENKTQGYSTISISNSGYSVAVPMDKVLELTQ